MRYRVIYLALLLSLLTISSYGVEVFKVSNYDGGHQIWFEAEAFDERSPNENYKLGKAENALKPHITGRLKGVS